MVEINYLASTGTTGDRVGLYVSGRLASCVIRKIALHTAAHSSTAAHTAHSTTQQHTLHSMHKHRATTHSTALQPWSALLPLPTLVYPSPGHNGQHTAAQPCQHSPSPTPANSSGYPLQYRKFCGHSSETTPIFGSTKPFSQSLQFPYTQPVGLV